LVRGYIVAWRRGFREDELVDVLSLDEKLMWSQSPSAREHRPHSARL